METLRVAMQTDTLGITVLRRRQCAALGAYRAIGWSR